MYEGILLSEIVYNVNQSVWRRNAKDYKTSTFVWISLLNFREKQDADINWREFNDQ